LNVSENREAEAGEIEPGSQSERHDDRPVETTTGEPNTFEPDADVASTLTDKTVEFFG
jgi:hypothetical protein